MKALRLSVLALDFFRCIDTETRYNIKKKWRLAFTNGPIILGSFLPFHLKTEVDPAFEYSECFCL